MPRVFSQRKSWRVSYGILMHYSSLLFLLFSLWIKKTNRHASRFCSVLNTKITQTLFYMQRLFSTQSQCCIKFSSAEPQILLKHCLNAWNLHYIETLLISSLFVSCLDQYWWNSDNHHFLFLWKKKNCAGRYHQKSMKE